MIVNLGLPLIIGAFGVLQNTLNRYLSAAIGLPWLLLINATVLWICAALFFAALRWLPAESLPSLYRTAAQPRAFQPLDLIPGLLGFFIISTAPWAIERIGATRVFIGIVAAQLLVSLVWDAYVDALPIGFGRAAGTALALLGAALASFA